MSRPPSQPNTHNADMHLAKELYLSVFVLFFRISRWKGRLKASAASICVALVEGVLALTIWLWLQMATHQYIELSGWIVAICIFLIAGPGDYFLVVRGHGVAFDKQFRSFIKRKQITLYFGVIAIIIVIGIAFYLSVAAYHRAFNLPRT